METNQEKKITIDPVFKNVFKIISDIFKIFPKYLYLLFFLFVVGYFYVKYTEKKKKPLYNANISFMISTDQGGSGGQVTPNILSDLGLEGGRGLETGLNPSRVKELLQTKMVLFNVLFKKCKINNKEDYIANHFLIIHQEDFGFKNRIDTSYFNNVTTQSAFTRSQNGMFNNIVSRIVSKHFSVNISPTNMFTISANTYNEILTYEFCYSIYNSLSDYYIKISVEKAKSSYDFIDRRLDSISTELIKAENRLASWRDNNANLIRARGFLEEERLIRDVTQLNNRYLQTISRHEIAKIKLDNQAPVFQVVDPPTYPLPNINRKDLSIMYIFMIIGSLALYIIIITGIYFYKNYKHVLKQIINELRGDGVS